MIIIFTNTAIYDNNFLLLNQHLMGNTTMTINKPITILELGPAQPQLIPIEFSIMSCAGAF